MTMKLRYSAYVLGALLLTALLVAISGGVWGDAGALAQTEQVAEAAEAIAPGTIVPPNLTVGDYPQIAGVNGRVAVWLVAQLHLWFAAFVLAVPIFVFIIEAIGMGTRDKRYDDMAYEFIKVSITAYSLTAILGGLLSISLLVFYPGVMVYMSGIFKESMFWYAMLFFVESACRKSVV